MPPAEQQRSAVILPRTSCIELPGQVTEGLLFPAGLCFGDDGLFHQGSGEGSGTLKGGTQQVETGKAQKAFQCAEEGAQSGGQIRDLRAGGGDLEVIVGFAALLEAVVGQRRSGAGEHGACKRVQAHSHADEEQVGGKGHQQVIEHDAHAAEHEGLFAAQADRPPCRWAPRTGG